MNDADILRRLERLERRTISGPMVSTSYGATEIRPWQVGIPVELTSSYDEHAGYSWKQLFLDTAISLSTGTGVSSVTEPVATRTGDYAFTIDNNKSLTAGVRGWLEIDPQARGWLFIYSAQGPAPAAPTSATATPISGSQVTVGWTDTTGAPPAYEYIVYIGSDSTLSDATVAARVAPGDDPYTVTDLDEATTYYFAVSATSPTGAVSPYSNVVSATTFTGGQEFATAGSYTFTASVTGNHTIRCWGGGGRGGVGGGMTGGGGGGGGGFAQKVVALTASTNYAVVVGAGDTTGVGGGNSTFETTTVVAIGGNPATSTLGGTGGSGGTGDVTYAGGNGADASGDNGGGGGSSAGTGAAGGNASGTTGGTAPSGGGAGGNGGTEPGSGIAGAAPGGGGGGTSTSGSEGNGAAGKVTITW